jgi:hypothetical protein
MSFLRSLLIATGTHWMVSELLRHLVYDSQLTVIATAVWLLVGYRKLFGNIPETSSMRDAARAACMAWLWPLAAKKK